MESKYMECDIAHINGQKKHLDTRLVAIRSMHLYLHVRTSLLL